MIARGFLKVLNCRLPTEVHVTQYEQKQGFVYNVKKSPKIIQDVSYIAFNIMFTSAPK